MFMYSRLLLARDLLSHDGVIFISIDDNERANLKLICDDVFGEENFVGDVIKKTKSMTGDEGAGLNLQHEHLLIFCRKKINVFLYGNEKSYKSYSNPDDDIKGDWVSGDPSAKSGGESTYFKIYNPHTKNFDLPPNGRFWAFSETSLKQYIKSGKVVFKKEHKANERGFVFKRYKNELQSENDPLNSLFIDNKYMNQVGTKELRELLHKEVFSNPKPIEFLKEIILGSTPFLKEDVFILDFFSGSATTAHSVMELNAKDGGNRKFISVQIPEILSPDVDSQKIAYEFLMENNLPTTLDYIGIERIKRAAAKIKEVHPDKELDLGFKHFTLAEPNQNTLDKLDSFDKAALLADTTILDDFGKPTILATWLNADGYGLTAEAAVVDLAGYTAYYMDKHLYLIDAGFTLESMKALLSMYDSEGRFNPENVVLFGYSFPQWSITEMIEQNLRILNDGEKNLKINYSVRY